MNTKILIAYFSHWGHTKQFAQMIGQLTGGDLFEIKTDHYYPLEHDHCSAQAHQEQLDDYRPHLINHVSNMKQYDVVFIGHPIWWYREPMVIRSFWEEYDFSNKIIVPFCTSGDVDVTNTEKDAKKYLANSIIKKGLRLGSDDVQNSKQEITAWLNSLNLRKDLKNE